MVAALSFYTAPMEKYRRPLKGRQNFSYCRLKDAPLAQNNISHFHVNRLPQRLNKLGGDWPNGYNPFCGKRSLSLIPFCNKTDIGLYRENAIAIESEARYPFGGNVYYVTMEITFPIPEFARKERNFHCDVVHVTTKWVSRLVLDHAIAAIQTSR